jgi:membrane-associated phospholipid phosphatase
VVFRLARRRSWWHRLRLRPRLALAALAGFLIAVPVTFLALAVRNGWGPVKRFDLRVAGALHREVGRHDWLADTLRALDMMLHPWVFRAAVVGLVLLLARRGAWRLAWWAVITMTTGSVLGLVLKIIIARTRPSFDLPLATAPGYSFPSGHALNSTVGALVLLLAVLPALPTVRRKAAAWSAALIVIGLTGFDRIGLGVHYVSDVVAGFLVGVALVAATAAAFETWRRDVGRPAHDPLAGVDPEEARQVTG